MNRIILFSLLVILATGISGCTANNNQAITGTPVDRLDPKPLAPVLTEPAPSPASNTHYRENVSPVAGFPGSEDANIQIGDVLEVVVAEDRSFNGNYEVRVGGYFILPAVGRIEAVGLHLNEIETNVTKALEETQLPHATVRVTRLGGTHSGRQR